MCKVPSLRVSSHPVLHLKSPKDWSHDGMTLPHLELDDHGIHLFVFLAKTRRKLTWEDFENSK